MRPTPRQATFYISLCREGESKQSKVRDELELCGGVLYPSKPDLCSFLLWRVKLGRQREATQIGLQGIGNSSIQLLRGRLNGASCFYVEKKPIWLLSLISLLAA